MINTKEKNIEYIREDIQLCKRILKRSIYSSAKAMAITCGPSTLLMKAGMNIGIDSTRVGGDLVKLGLLYSIVSGVVYTAPTIMQTIEDISRYYPRIKENKKNLSQLEVQT